MSRRKVRPRPRQVVRARIVEPEETLEDLDDIEHEGEASDAYLLSTMDDPTLGDPDDVAYFDMIEATR